MIWLIVMPGPSKWSYIKAEAPCWKAEVNMSFKLFSLTLGWKGNEPMTLKQILGLDCRHKHLSHPVDRRQHCVECGKEFEFDTFDLTEKDKRPANHYLHRESSINRVSRKVLKWKSG
jgi:hypothetical protein